VTVQITMHEKPAESLNPLENRQKLQHQIQLNCKHYSIARKVAVIAKHTSWSYF